MTRIGITYMRAAGNPRNIGLLKQPRTRIGRLPIPEGVTLHPLTDAEEKSSNTKKLSSAKNMGYSLLAQHKDGLMSLAIGITSLNLNGVDLPDLLHLKDVLRNSPFPTVLAAKLRIIMAKNKMRRFKNN
jgi:hypothetical protein